MQLVGLGGTAVEEDHDYLGDCQSQIYDGFVKSGFGGRFMPESSLSLLVAGIDFSLLLPGASKDLTGFIRSKAKRVFLTTLISTTCDGPDLVVVFDTFQKHGFTDAILPVENIPKNKSRTQGSSVVGHNIISASFGIKQWGFVSIKNFQEYQWKFISPVFDQSYLKNYSKGLPENAILPFVRKIKIPQSGHFSDVYQATLREDHQDKLKKDDGADGVPVALKVLKSKIPGEDRYDVEIAWKREADALDQLSKLDHPNLIRRIAPFKWREEHYIMFEWANGGTLREFWDNNRNAHFELNGDRISQFLTQLCGLAEATCMLHNTNPHTSTGLEDTAKRKLSFTSNGQPLLASEVSLSDSNNMPGIDLLNEELDNTAKHWRHGDIKPENILVAKNPSSWLGILKIADLGLAKQHEFATAVRVEVTSTEHTTLHYEAPEAVTNKTKPRSRRYDIWSMGCIILESVIWLLYGSDGLDEFYREKKKLQSRAQHSLYFTTETHENGLEVASVSETVTTWITGMLEHDPECNKATALRELLELVKDKLLVIAVSTGSKPNAVPVRADAAELHRRINRIRLAAEDDPEYLFTGRSRKDIQVPWSLRAIQKDASRKRTHRHQEYLSVNRSSVNRLLPHRSPQHAMDTYRHVSQPTMI
ncbi:putative serine threonine protein kinase [Rosellinia necatrix]|uniref:Putative serine threonine protein kinase n=1 Tax=Rosellinia necatrix TaxID=77044 RepID=A0A1S8A6Z9_ROSNE|nr:putative serine threonine protein kinase [Rosellinia necatrix]